MLFCLKSFRARTDAPIIPPMGPTYYRPEYRAQPQYQRAQWKCVQVDDYRKVGKTVQEYEEKGWRLHSYACAGTGAMMAVNHYLLFEKGE